MRLDRFKLLRWLVLAPVLAAAGCLMLADDPAGWSCQSDADCHGDERCAQPPGFSHTVCVQPAACGLHNTCPDGSACHSGVCPSRPCEVGDSTCGDYACYPGTRTCRETCLDSSHCASGFTCNISRCVPVECSAPDDPACHGYRCESTRLCETSCHSDLQCASGRRCSDGECVPRTCSDGSAAGACNGGAAGSISATGGSGGSGGSSGKGGVGGKSGSPGTSGYGGSGGSTPVCDPVAQTGCKKGQKCTVRTDNSLTYTILCDKAGSAPLDASCESVNDSANDACAPGLFCSNLGYLDLDSFSDTRHRCRSFCRVDADCGDSAFCAAAGYDPTGLGLCMPSCTPFEPCPGKAQSTCGQPYVVNGTSTHRLTCRLLGPAQNDGGFCALDYPCQAGYTCTSGGCLPLCDAAHPCSGSATCKWDGPTCAADDVCLCL